MGAIVSSPPERVDIWFTQELFRREGENWIYVEDSLGARVEAGDAQIDDDDRTHLSIALLPDLEPGSYRVSWRSLSAEDGDAAEGEFSFSYDPQAAVTSTPMSVESPTVPPGPTAEARANATSPPTAAPAAGSPTELPPPQPDAGGCGIGLAPLGGLLLIALPGALERRRRG